MCCPARTMTIWTELFGASHQLYAWFRALLQAAIGGEIVERHAAPGEAGLKLLSDGRSAQARQPINGADRTGFILDDKAGQALIDDLGDRATVICNDRRPACHRFDHDEAERLGPIDRQQQPDRATEGGGFFVVADLADIFDERVIHQRANNFIVIFLVGSIDLRGDLERNTAPDRNLDRPVYALLRRNPAEHG